MQKGFKESDCKWLTGTTRLQGIRRSSVIACMCACMHVCACVFGVLISEPDGVL